MWLVKELSLLKAMNAEHIYRSKFAAVSLVMVTATRELKIAPVVTNDQTNKTNKEQKEVLSCTVSLDFKSNCQLFKFGIMYPSLSL
jgi:hypothetical protein